MRLRVLSIVLFAFAIFSYSGKKEKIFLHPTSSGLYFEHGPRQGFSYKDQRGIEYNFRYFTSSITNDSTVPVQVKIAFSKEYLYPDSADSAKFKVFILPQSLEAFTEQDVKKFLDSELEKPIRLNKIIKAKEEGSITIGVLSEVKYPDPRTLVLISKGQKYHSVNDAFIINPAIEVSEALSLSLGVVFKEKSYTIIPCGRFNFRSNKIT